MKPTTASPVRAGLRGDQRSGWNRAHAAYIRNALDPISASVYDDLTIGQLKSAAREYADCAWQDHMP